MRISLVEEGLRLPARDLKISLGESLSRLELISGLQNGWQGEETKTFSRELISYLENLIPQLPLVPLPVPSVKGSIVLEWENSECGFLTLDIFPNYRVELYAVSADGFYEIEEVTTTQELFTWVEAFSKNKIFTKQE